jgi:uncharacterized damage-inducible protein DinB
MLVAHFKDLYLHMHWADAMMWNVIARTESALSDDSILDTFLHLHETQHAFLRTWHDEPFKRRTRDDFSSASSLMAWGRQFHESVQPFVDQLNEDEMDQPAVLPWAKWFVQASGRDPEITSLSETLHQVTSHSMHHRGQIARRTRVLGMTPPSLDYIVWVWEGRPSARWPE